MPDSEILVRVDGVSKKFCRSLKKSLWYGVKDMAHELNPFGGNRAEDRRSQIADRSPSPISHLPSPAAAAAALQSPLSALRPDEFYAVRDVSFELRRGECLGLIGRNGAGKTTLLKMLNGLIKPDHGHIEMRGRVGALIALGAGFNPILTGRENIYVNGSVLGLAKQEIDAKLEEIIDFAEIREFIDSPVQNYSSGMQVRLGFAVTTALSPDILLIDEALAVGDVRFRSKCYNRLESIRKKTAIIFVSHNRAELTRICQHGLLLVDGRVKTISALHRVLNEYDLLSHEGGPGVPHTIDSHGIEVKHIGLEHNTIFWNQSAFINVQLRLTRNIPKALYRVSIMDSSEQCVAEWKSSNHNKNNNFVPGDCVIKIELNQLRLSSGSYSLNFILGAENEAEYLVLRCGFAMLKIEGAVLGLARYQI